MFVLMLNDKFVLDRLCFATIEDLKDYLTCHLGKSVTIEKVRFDPEVAQPEFVEASGVTTIDRLVTLLLAQETIRVFAEMFAPYDSGFLSIIELTHY